MSSKSATNNSLWVVVKSCADGTHTTLPMRYALAVEYVRIMQVKHPACAYSIQQAS